jgi:hypothetical protein
MTLSELIKEIISEWGCRVDDGMPNPKNPQHLKELRDVLDVMGLSSIKNELIENLLEGDNFKNPALNKVVRYKDVHGEDAEGKVGNLMRRPSEEDAHQKAVSTLGGKDSDRYKEAMNDLGGEGQPKKKDEKEKEGGSEDGTPSVTGTAFDLSTDGGKEYIDSLPDNDPASEEEITELLEAFFGEDVETLTEGSFLKPEYKVGHQIIFSKENPPKWAPELKNGDVLTIVVDDDRIIPHGEGEFVKTLQLPNGKLVRVADKNVGGGESKKFKHLKKGASAAAPSGEDWEALIVCGYNGIDESSPEWKRAQIFWANYGKDAQKIANEFRGIIKSNQLSQLGSSTAAINSDWGGTNKTPKTDILGNNNEKISLKKAPDSQLMSAAPAEAIATFQAALKLVGENQPQLLKSFLDGLEEKMGKMSEKGTITAWQELKDSGQELTPAQEKAIAEMEQLQLNAKEITKDMETIFKDMYFKSCFCFEAATGTSKFADKNAIANKIVEFDASSGKITSHLSIQTINDASVLAAKNSFFVSFKTGSPNSMPYLALRSKKLSKSQLTEEVTLKDIITEEFSKYNFGEQILLEGDRQQLNEFQIFNKLAAGLKNVSTKVKNQVKNILSTIMARVKEAIDYIKTLGGKIFNAILNFLGMEVTDVDIKTSGPFPLI